MFKSFVNLDVLLGHGRWARPVHLIQQLKQQEVNYNQRYHLLPKITARCLVGGKNQEVAQIGTYRENKGRSRRCSAINSPKHILAYAKGKTNKMNLTLSDIWQPE